MSQQRVVSLYQVNNDCRAGFVGHRGARQGQRYCICRSELPSPGIEVRLEHRNTRSMRETRHTLVAIKRTAPLSPTTIDAYQTGRTRVSAATAPRAIATWNRATLLANRCC